MGIRAGIPRPATFGGVVNPFLRGKNSAAIGGDPLEHLMPQPRPNPIPGAPPMREAMAPFDIMSPDAMGAPQMVAASAMPMPQRQPGGGFMSGLKGGLNDFLGSDASLAMAAGLLGGGSTSQAIGRGFGNAYQARADARPKANELPEAYQIWKLAGKPGGFGEWYSAQKKGSGINIDMGGGTDKQVFDAMNESTTSARSASQGLASLSQARQAVEAGIIAGAGADFTLGLQKIGAMLGIADPEIIQNTEVFRSSIAPQVAALMKATVGSTQISNADREFAEKAAGGSISLDSGSILRLLDIMERASVTSIQTHNDRLNAVYPEAPEYARERALFGVPLPRPGAPAPAPGPAAPMSEYDQAVEELRRRGGR